MGVSRAHGLSLVTVGVALRKLDTLGAGQQVHRAFDLSGNRSPLSEPVQAIVLEYGAEYVLPAGWSDPAGILLFGAAGPRRLSLGLAPFQPPRSSLVDGPASRWSSSTVRSNSSKLGPVLPASR